MIENKDWENWQEVMATEAADITAEKSRRVKRPRPGHADLAGGLKYDARDLRNVLERASARETAARVACGAIAKQLLAQFGVEIRSHVIQLGGIPDKPLELTFHDIASIPNDSPLNCADANAQQKMIELIDQKKGEAIRSVESLKSLRTTLLPALVHIPRGIRNWMGDWPRQSCRFTP
jgi:chorismate synthase